MGRFLIVSAGFSLDHHAKDLGVVGFLSERGHAVRHIVIGDGIAPGYPKEWTTRPEFRESRSKWRQRPMSAISDIAWSDVVLVPNARGAGRLSQLAHLLGRTVVQHDNVGGMDFYFYGADYAAVKGDYFAELIGRADELPTGAFDEVPLFLRDSLRGLGALPAGRIAVTGCVQFDAGMGQGNPAMTRDEFCERYELDPGKSIAVWLPDGAQNQDEWSRRKYAEICTAVEQSATHSLIIKLHPNDFLRWKADVHLGGARSSDVIFPRAPVCLPEHKYDCFRHCDVGITVLSTVALEFPLFRRPVLFVDSSDSPIVQRYSHFRKTGVPVYGSVGSCCKADSLTDVLDTRGYDVADVSLFDAHVQKYSCSRDGKAYERVARLVERAATEMPAQRLASKHWCNLVSTLFSELRERRRKSSYSTLRLWRAISPPPKRT